MGDAVMAHASRRALFRVACQEAAACYRSSSECLPSAAARPRLRQAAWVGGAEAFVAHGHCALQTVRRLTAHVYLDH